MSLKIAADPGVQVAVGVTAGTTGYAAWLVTAKEIASEFFGVPLPVLLAAATGAFGALSFVSATTYLRTLGIGIVWTLAGTFSAQLALWAIGAAFSTQVPTGALAGAAILVSAAGPVLVTKDNVQKLREAAARKLDDLWRKP